MGNQDLTYFKFADEFYDRFFSSRKSSIRRIAWLGEKFSRSLKMYNVPGSTNHFYDIENVNNNNDSFFWDINEKNWDIYNYDLVALHRVTPFAKDSHNLLSNLSRLISNNKIVVCDFYQMIIRINNSNYTFGYYHKEHSLVCNFARYIKFKNYDNFDVGDINGKAFLDLWMITQAGIQIKASLYDMIEYSDDLFVTQQRSQKREIYQLITELSSFNS